MMTLRASLLFFLAASAPFAWAEQPKTSASDSAQVAPFSSYKLSPYEKQERMRVYAWGVLRQKGQDCHNVAGAVRQADASILAVCTSKKQSTPMRYRIADIQTGQGKSVQVEALR